MLTRRKLFGALLVAIIGVLVVVGAHTRKPPTNEPGSSIAALSQSYIRVNRSEALRVPQLVTTTKNSFGAKELRGRWSLIFFGYTACPLVCPRTLSLLTAIAHRRESGVPSGTVQEVFVSVDPEHDTAERMAEYLRHFDHNIVGLTGTPDAVSSFTREIGAGYLPAGSSIDHSTSIFVVAPNGHLAGILLRPNQPSRILADLANLRLSYDGADAELSR